METVGARYIGYLCQTAEKGSVPLESSGNFQISGEKEQAVEREMHLPGKKRDDFPGFME